MSTFHRSAGAWLGLVLAAGGAAGEPATHRVYIEAMRFSPETLTVASGDRVLWENKDLVPHTVTAAGSRGFDSRTIAPATSWSHVFPVSGSFAYVCTLHPMMKATVIVSPR